MKISYSIVARVLAAVLGASAVSILAISCSGAAPKVMPESEPPSLPGTWTARSTCTLGNGESGTGTLTMTFGETRWYVYRYCSSPSGTFRYIGDAGTWSIDGIAVTRTRLRGSEVETAIKTISWGEDGESFETHPFHWSADDGPTSMRKYTLVSRDTLPVADITGDWYVRSNDRVVRRYTFNPDRTFEFWYDYTRQGTTHSGELTTTGDWREGNTKDGTLYLSNIQATGADSEYPGQVIEVSAADIVAEVGIAPGKDAESIVIWVPRGHVPATNVEGFTSVIPTSQDAAIWTNVHALVR